MSDDIDRDLHRNSAPLNRTQARYPVSSVGTSLALLALFRTRYSLRVIDAARGLDIAPSTAHRLLAMHVRAGMLRQEPVTRAYHVGPVLTELARAIDVVDVVETRAKPHLVRLAAATGETVHLVTLIGSDAVFLAGVESPRALRAGDRTGSALPAHATAGGKAMLALLSDAQLQKLLPERLPALTAHTTTTRAALVRDLRRARERGYATNRNESEAGLSAFAHAFTGPRDGRLYAFLISGPNARLERSGNDLIAAVQRSAAVFEAEIF